VFYTYAHYTPEGHLFYIGKGNRHRAHAKIGRNTHWRNVVNKHGDPEVKILANWGTESEALDHERFLIKCFRELGHKLCNLSDGGKGNAGIKVSPETKLKISFSKKGTPAWNKGLPLAQDCKQKLSAVMTGRASWNKGKTHSQEHRAKIGFSKVGNLNCLQYQIVGTQIDTQEQVKFFGAKAVDAAGFIHTAVYMCIKGTRKSHKGYTWHKELLENK
jgi:hypothetical protein